MIWDSLTACLCAIASHVALRDEHFDLVLEMLDPVLARPDVKAALDTANPDAVWLRLYQKQRAAGTAMECRMPVVQGWTFVVV